MLKELFHRLDRCNFLILHRCTGAPKELGKKLGLSESRTYDLIRELKELGFPIDYDRCRKTYYYTEPGSFNVKFMRDGLTRKDRVSMHIIRKVIRRMTDCISFILPVFALEEIAMLF